MDRDATIHQLRAYFTARVDVAAAWSFGSVARGADHRSSDVDVAVLLRRHPRTAQDLEAVAEVQDDLQGLLRLEVDVAVVNRAAPDFVHRVLRDGVLVHESDHDARVAFEVQSRKEYWDLLPILQRYRRTVPRKS